MTYHNIQSLAENHNYIPTDEFNGQKTARRNQQLTITGAVRVPADWKDNPQIIGIAICEGKRGAAYSAHIMLIDGRIRFNVID